MRRRLAGERPDGKNGRLVESEITAKEGPPIKLQWRIRQGAESLKIVDILVEGVSMAVTQRSEFTNVVRSQGLEGLLQALRARTQRMPATS